jgi:hypothetical protein
VKTNPRALLKHALTCGLTVLSLALAVTAEAPPRLVAIADVHGAFPEFVAVLQRTKLVDTNRRWTGGATTFVQTGDVLDRGARSRECLDLVMDLERQAGRSGGRVVALIGNHEAMNAMGDLRYVTADIYWTFATDHSAEVRARAYEDYGRFLAAHAGHPHSIVPPADEAQIQKWNDAHPPGFFEYRDAFGPNGTYGRWIRGHHAIVKIGDGVFVHAGLDPGLEFASITALDDQVHAELTRFDSIWQALARKRVIWRYMTLVEAVRQVTEELKWIEGGGVADSESIQQMRTLVGYRTWMAASTNGPLWFRGLAEDPEEKLTVGLDAMLARLGATFIVSGHTVVATTGVTQRFANRVFLLDTGMLKEEYKGRASALEVQDGRFTAYYADGDPKSLPAPGAARRSPDRTEALAFSRQD